MSGKDAFLLYDTYGFPLEITQELAAAQHVTVDVEGFTQEMQVCLHRLSVNVACACLVVLPKALYPTHPPLP